MPSRTDCSGADITAVVKEAATAAQRRQEGALRAVLSLNDLQSAAARSTATAFDAAAIDAFATSH